MLVETLQVSSSESHILLESNILLKDGKVMSDQLQITSWFYH